MSNFRTPLRSAASGESDSLSAITDDNSRMGTDVGWRDVEINSFTRKKPIRILDRVSGDIHAGECCAILGPSGAGKSSLLNFLAGRLKASSNFRISGEVLIGRQAVSPSQYRKHIAYVLQEDCLLATSTPREELHFSARLRLPSSLTATQREQRVNNLLVALKLQKCADTMIGSAIRAGISGGEKKRTAVAIELITNPKVLFLDEPTSGLDSFAAYSVVSMLQSIAKSGCTVLCTIHQPSSEIFHLFSSMVLLHNGRTVFAGQTNNLVSHFGSKGHHCPPNYNPADFALFFVQTESTETIRALEQPFVGDSRPGTYSERPFLFEEKKSGFFVQLWMLSAREFRGVVRDKPALIARFGVLAALNLLFAVIFYKIGESDDLMSHFGGLTQILISSLMSSTQPLILQFPLDRPIFLREYAVGTYGGIAYFLSKTSVELVMTFLSSVVVWMAAYWLMALQGNIIVLIGITWALALVASSFALFLGCVAKNVNTAMQTAPVVLVPQLLFAGFFIKMSQIPEYIRWAQYLCSLKFAMNLAMLTEFDHCSADMQPECDHLLDQNDVHYSLWYIYCLVLFALFVVFRTAAFVALTMQAS